jgi:hypothetical protein
MTRLAGIVEDMGNPATLKTVRVFLVAIIGAIFGRSITNFSGSGLDWAMVIGSALGVGVIAFNLISDFWKSDA